MSPGEPRGAGSCGALAVPLLKHTAPSDGCDAPERRGRGAR